MSDQQSTERPPGSAPLLQPPRRPGHDHLILAIQELGLAMDVETKAGQAEQTADINRLIIDTYEAAKRVTW